MKVTDLSFLVVGAGAVGGISAALMRSEGLDVEILCKSDEYASLISERGLKILGARGELTVRVPAYPSSAAVSGKKDIILLATKAPDMVDAARSVIPVLNENGYFVSMQNGICEDGLMSVVGNDRVIGCVTGWGATMESKGVLNMTSSGDFILGYPERKPDDKLTKISEALSSIVPARTTDNIIGHKFSKLIINSCITSLGAICGMYLGNMLKHVKIRNIFIEIIREAVAVADKLNISPEVFGGKLDFRKFISGNGFFAEQKRHLMIRIIGAKYRRLKSSSLQSLERGKLSEVDYLNGYIAVNGLKYGVDVPVNKAITDIIHEIERKQRKISPDNFNDPIFDRFK
jgi:2-dehydropantoate 2-reductase